MNIIHCFRAPVGGLFRHVRDLAEAQTAAGHRVGAICDSTTGGPFEEQAIARFAPTLSLGLLRIPMERRIGPRDLVAAWRIRNEVRSLNPDVLHGHGAKGGAYARTIGTILRATGNSVARIYTPHGGSLHYDPRSAAGRVYFAAERLLGRMTDAFVFVSRYEAETYSAKVGRPSRPVVIVPNGLRPEEFEPVAPAGDAADFLFVGTLRDLKGPDLLIEATRRVAARSGRSVATLIVGAGDDKPRYEALAAEAGPDARIAFHDPMPARDAFPLGRVMVVPSRAESMPYIVLETAAAGVPLIATRVGGIPEIYGDAAGRLVPPDDAGALADAMLRTLEDPASARRDADALRALVGERFTIPAMAAGVADAYRQAGIR